VTLAVASLFAGFGGSSLGYRAAGLDVVFANERDGHARQAYRLNLGLDPDGRDVRELRGRDILDAVEARTGWRELHVLDASPPCQSWS
jgi:DNA (cytosine-5)-methyltransferase 1